MFHYLICLVITVLVLIILHLRGTLRYMYLTSKIPGLSCWDLMTVHAKEFVDRDRTLTHACKVCYQYSHKPFGTWFITTDFGYMVSDPDTISEVLQNKHLQNKPYQVFGYLSRYAGWGLIQLNGETWRIHRKIMNPSFKKNILDSNVYVTVDGAETLVEKFREIADGRSIDISEIIEDVMFDVTTRFFTSNILTFPSTRQFSESLAYAYESAQRSFINPIYHWFRVTFHGPTRKAERDVRSVVLDNNGEFLTQLERTKMHLNNNFDTEPKDGMEAAVITNAKAGNPMNDQELYEEFLELLVAAAEPIATATKAAMMMLALNQDVQHRLHQEIEQLFKDCNQLPTAKDFENMAYLTMVVKETLRLFPLGCIIARRVEEETELNGTILPKDAMVLMNIMALHRHPDHFEDPLMFKPERFLPEVSEKRHPFAYIPFSYGPRTCIGQVHAVNSIRVLLCYILRAYQVFPGEGLKGLDDVKVRMTVTLQVKGQIRLLKRRV